MKLRASIIFLGMSGLLGAIGLAADRPNVVLFIADDISWDDFGCYGHPTIKTPHIDSLAAGGLRFTNAYLTTSSCSPSRCSLITGRYPHNTGAPELHTNLPEGQVLFPRLLKDTGYYTVLSGKHHMGEAANPAFSTVSPGRGPGKEADWVDLLKERPMGQPFFCWYASSDAHRRWTINEQAPQYGPNETIIPPYLIDGPKTREDLTGYYHEVSRFDHFVGQVVQELERQEVLNSTVIMVMADNGRPFPRCKTRLYDSGIKTPLVVHFPDGIQAGVTDSLVSAIDIAATVLELAGIRKDERIQGVSFAPVLSDPNSVTREVAFAEHNWHVYRNHERLVRIGPFLYIRNNFPNQQNLCVEAYQGGSGEELWETQRRDQLSSPQRNIFRNPCPAEELYHVVNDPDQIANLAGQSEHQATIQRMRRLLDQWTRQTGDTIPTRPSPHRDAPPGSPPKDRNDFRRGEMPGDASGAQTINHPGPIQVDHVDTSGS